MVTDQTTLIHDISLVTTLENSINLFGIKVEIPYDVKKIIISDVSDNSYTWNFPFDSEYFPDIPPDVFATAFFMDVSGNRQEIKQLIDASNMTFETSLTKTINLFGINVDVPYDTKSIIIKDVSNNTYNWELPFNVSYFPKLGPNTVIASAFFMDICGNTQEISGNFIAYNIGSLNKTREHYVELKADINKEIYQDESGNYGIYGAVIDKSNEAYDISYCLPTGSKIFSIKSLPIYKFNNQDNLLGIFDLIVDISTNTIGEIYCETYFKVLSISPDADSTMIINSLNNYYKEKLDEIKLIYNNKKVITEWEMKLLESHPSQDSIVNQVNDYLGGTRTLPNFFNDGESITLVLGYDLELNIKDLQGNNVNIIPSTRIYAVITQDSNAPRLNISNE